MAYGLAIFDIVTAFALMLLVQISTRTAAFHGEFQLRSLLRRVIYYVVILTLCYRSYALAEHHFDVTLAGAVTNVILITSIFTLGVMDAVWERQKRRRVEHVDHSSSGSGSG